MLLNEGLPTIFAHALASPLSAADSSRTHAHTRLPPGVAVVGSPPARLARSEELRADGGRREQHYSQQQRKEETWSLVESGWPTMRL